MKRKFTFLITAALMLLTMMATTGKMWGQTTVTYKLTISPSDFNSTSYAANNNEKTSYAVCTTDNTKTFEVKWTSNQVMLQSSNMQWQKNNGYIYNSTNLGTITGVTVTSSAGTFTTYYGTSEQPSSGTSGSGKGYFKTSVGNATGKSSKLEVTFTITTYTVTYDGNDATSGTAPTDSNSPYLSGSDVTVLGNTGSLVKDGYNFSGWCLNAAGTGTVYGPGDGQTHTLESLSDNTVFYAKWTAAGDYITVAPTTANVACSGDDVEFSIDTDQTLNVNPVAFYTTSSGDVTTTKPSWIGDLSSAYNSGTGKLTVPVTANTGAARTAYFRVEKDDVKSDVITINQAVYAPSAPTLPAAGNFDYTKEITITIPDGTTVYYTLDGADPTSSSTAYSAPFTIDATKTVKAVAYDNGYPSAVVSATYTRTYDYISSINSTTTTYKVKGTVVAVNGTTGFVIGDGTGYVYDYKSSHGLSVGDMVEINGKVSKYNYGYQFSASTTPVLTSSYTTGTPAITTLTGDIYDSYHSTGAVNLSTYFEVIGTYSNTNKDITLAGTTKHVRLLTSTDYSSLDGKAVKAKGYFIYYNSYFFICPENVEAVPVVTASVTSISDFTYNVGGGPDIKSFTVSGANLTNDLTVTASTNYKVCKTSDGEYTTSVSYEPSTGTVASTTVYVRLEAGLSSNTYEGTVTVASTDADDKVVALTGTVKHTITIDPSIENGAVNSEPSEAALAGATVTLTAEPAANYKLGSFTVTKAGSGTVDVTPTGANTGTFTMPADNVTVSATFTQAYAVTYAANGGSGTMTDPNSPYVAGTQVTLLANTFTYAGHTWSGWLVKNASTDETINPDGEGKFEMPASAVTVTAQWTTNTHNITMPDADAYGEYTTTLAMNVPFGTEVTLTYTPASGYEHYVAVWSVNGTPIDGNTFNMPDEDVTVTVTTHATWTVTYNANGGTGSMSDPNSPYDDGANVTVLANGFTYINHTFVKWNTQANGEGTDYAPGATISGISDDVTLYAQWESGSYATYAITSSTAVSTTGSAPLGSSASFSQPSGTLKQLVSGNSMTLTLSGYQGQTVKSVVLSMHSNSKSGAGTLSIKAGETTLASISTAADFNTSSWYGGWTQSYVDVTPTMSNDSYEIQSGENIVITITSTANSLYCESFTINYETTITDPTVFVSPTEQLVSHTSQNITTGDKIFSLYSMNIASPTFALAFCNSEGTVLESNPYEWFTPSVTDNEKVTYSVTANSGKDRTAYFKVYATGVGDPVYSSLCSVTQKHQPYTYTLVDGSTVTLEAGKHYLIASSKTTGAAYAMGTQNSNYRNLKAIEIKEKVISETTYQYIEETEDVCEVVLSGYEDNWTIYDKNYPGYLYASSSSSNNLNTQDENDDEGVWSISISSGAATVIAQGDNTNKYLRYNSGSRFSCYSSSSSVDNPIYFFMRDNDKDLEFYSPTTLSSATIASTETYTVESGQILEVTGTLTNKGTAANLIIKDGGQLKFYATGAKDGGVQATVEKNITGYGNDNTVKTGWNFIASPINVDDLAPTNVTNMLSNPYDLYQLNNTKWENYKQHEGNDHPNFSLTNGRGYLYANSNDITLSFAGTIKPFTTAGNANQVALADGWNLVGNPYTFNVYSSKSYYTIVTENEENVIKAVSVASDAIAPCTGIVINSTGDDDHIAFLESAASWSTGNQGNIQLTLAQQTTNRGNANIDNVIVSFNEGSELEKFYFIEQNASLYIPQGNEEYAIVSSNGQGEMPVNFKAAQNGTYTLSIEAENVEMDYLHLIDNMTGADVDLLQTPSYSFTSKTTDYASRFRLVFSANSVNDDSTSSETFAFINGEEIVITNAEADATLQVVDMTGRILVNTKGANRLSTAGMTQGVYVIRMVNGEKVKTQKIVVR